MYYDDKLAENRERSTGKTVHDVREYGAKGDGVTDDTEAFLFAMDRLPKSGGTVVCPSGCTFVIDPLREFMMRSYTALCVQAHAAIRALPHEKERSNLILIPDRVEQVRIYGGGTICGDLREHVFTDYRPGSSAGPSTHEWNHGIKCTGTATGVSIEDVHLSEFTGDGMSLSGLDVFVNGVISTGNRRQALTLGRGERFRVFNSVFEKTGGNRTYAQFTKPGAGIDIEPDAPKDPTEDRVHQDTLIWRCVMSHNQGVGLLNWTRIESDRPNAIVKDVICAESKIYGNSGNGFEASRCTGIDLFMNRIFDNKFTGARIGPGAEVHVAENVFWGNYHRGSPYSEEARADFVQFGWSKSIEKDVLIVEGTGQIGRNYHK